MPTLYQNEINDFDHIIRMQDPFSDLTVISEFIYQIPFVIASLLVMIYQETMVRNHSLWSFKPTVGVLIQFIRWYLGESYYQKKEFLVSCKFCQQSCETLSYVLTKGVVVALVLTTSSTFRIWHLSLSLFLYFLVLFMGLNLLFQLTFIFIYNIFSKKFLVSEK